MPEFICNIVTAAVHYLHSSAWAPRHCEISKCCQSTSKTHANVLQNLAAHQGQVTSLVCLAQVYDMGWCRAQVSAGDAFCLYFDATSKKVSALMGNGRSPQALTLEVRKVPWPGTGTISYFTLHMISVLCKLSPLASWQGRVQSKHTTHHTPEASQL